MTPARWLSDGTVWHCVREAAVLQVEDSPQDDHRVALPAEPLDERYDDVAAKDIQVVPGKCCSAAFSMPSGGRVQLTSAFIPKQAHVADITPGVPGQSVAGDLCGDRHVRVRISLRSLLHLSCHLAMCAWSLGVRTRDAPGERKERVRKMRFSWLLPPRRPQRRERVPKTGFPWLLPPGRPPRSPCRHRAGRSRNSAAMGTMATIINQLAVACSSPLPPYLSRRILQIPLLEGQASPWPATLAGIIMFGRIFLKFQGKYFLLACQASRRPATTTEIIMFAHTFPILVCQASAWPAQTTGITMSIIEFLLLESQAAARPAMASATASTRLT